MEYLAIAETFTEEPFLKKLTISPNDLEQFICTDEWTQAASTLFPITDRLSCAHVLDAVRPLMDRIAPVPGEGWLTGVYQTGVNRL